VFSLEQEQCSLHSYTWSTVHLPKRAGASPIFLACESAAQALDWRRVQNRCRSCSEEALGAAGAAAGPGEAKAAAAARSPPALPDPQHRPQLQQASQVKLCTKAEEITQ